MTLVARDRRAAYIRGITEGAPQAVQVADRWHLLANMRDVVAHVVRRRYRELERLPGYLPPTRPPRPAQKRTATERQPQQTTRDQRAERHATIRRLAASGLRYRTIARQLGVSWRTVERYAKAETVPEFARPCPLPSGLDPYLHVLKRCWVEGCTNGGQLWREIHAVGYRGGYRQVARWAQNQRLTEQRALQESDTAQRSAPAGSLPPARQLTWILVRPCADLVPLDLAILPHVQQDAEVGQVATLTQRFQTLIRTRNAHDLDAWLDDASASGMKEIQTFAKGLIQDLPAIRAALTCSASNGQTEDQVNRLKFIKRQGYGRAQFDLLRQRVLAVAYV